MRPPRFFVRLALAGALTATVAGAPTTATVAGTPTATVAGTPTATVLAQSPPARKRLLVIGEEKGYRHEAVTHAMVTIERLGREQGCGIP